MDKTKRGFFVLSVKASVGCNPINTVIQAVIPALIALVSSCADLGKRDMERGDEDMNEYIPIGQTDRLDKWKVSWGRNGLGGRWERKGKSEGVNIFFAASTGLFMRVEKATDTNNNTLEPRPF